MHALAGTIYSWLLYSTADGAVVQPQNSFGGTSRDMTARIDTRFKKPGGIGEGQTIKQTKTIQQLGVDLESYKQVLL